MARKSDGEKIDQLKETSCVLEQQMMLVFKNLDDLEKAKAQITLAVVDLRREFEKEIALLKRDVEGLKKEREEWNRRLWAFGPNALGALLSGIIAAIVAFFVAHR